jgi:hypothetical protein
MHQLPLPSIPATLSGRFSPPGKILIIHRLQVNLIIVNFDAKVSGIRPHGESARLGSASAPQSSTLMAKGRPITPKNFYDRAAPLFKQQFDLIFPASEFRNFGEAGLRLSEPFAFLFLPGQLFHGALRDQVPFDLRGQTERKGQDF